ncbi:hypothetical protein P7C70_g5676, partial [Phenoliferia sp. Uapishka_3]
MRFVSSVALATSLAVASVNASFIKERSPSRNIPAIVDPVLKNFGFDSSDIQTIAKPNAADRGPVNSFWSSWLQWRLKYELTSHPAPQSAAFESWKTFKANGVNLGAWMEIEITYAPGVIPDAYVDEWTWCEAVGTDVCGPVLEAHYASYITTKDIDKVAKYGVNTLRIAMTYAAFYAVPGSKLYTGNQLKYVSKVAEYAINTYGMHVVLGLHSLPGGVNDLEIGEASGHLNWWYNSTNYDASLTVVSKLLDFIEASPNSAAYTVSPINEPCDNPEYLFTTTAISYPDGVNYINSYYRAIYQMMQDRAMGNTLMLSDAYMGTSYWAPFWPADSNIAFDTHKYYFEPTGITGYDIPTLACAAAKNATTSFPVFVGEFAAMATENNTLAERAQIVQTEIYAWSKYLSGGTFWNLKYGGNATAAGEGSAADYWAYENLIDGGALNLGGVLTHVYKDC